MTEQQAPPSRTQTGSTCPVCKAPCASCRGGLEGALLDTLYAYRLSVAAMPQVPAEPQDTELAKVSGELLDALKQAEDEKEPLATVMLHETIAECCDKLRILLDREPEVTS